MLLVQKGVVAFLGGLLMQHLGCVYGLCNPMTTKAIPLLLQCVPMSPFHGCCTSVHDHVYADSGTHGIADSDADMAVCHDRARGDPVCHPPQHLCGQVANQDQTPCSAAHRCQGEVDRRSTFRYAQKSLTHTLYRYMQQGLMNATCSIPFAC